MFDFLKRKTAEEKEVAPPKEETTGIFSRLKTGLAKTRATFTSNLANLFLGKKKLDQSLIDEIETVLLTADVGIETTQQLINTLTQKLARNELADSDAAFQCLKAEMQSILAPCEATFDSEMHNKPCVILVVGINGAGKTTSIGKLASRYQAAGKSIMLAAGDTFRAAAIDQLKIWGERNNVPVIAQQPGSDTAAVIFDAVDAARARNMDILLADTAGRLHTQNHLIAELQKIKRVLTKTDQTAPHEVLLVLDATLGQNALNQVKQFDAAIGVTGLVLTKLDGTAKGGILFAIAKETNIPIRYIGFGETINDLKPFKADEFIDALFE